MISVFVADNIVDLMTGSIEVQPEKGYPAWIRINIGEMSCGVVKDLKDDVHMWLHELIEYSLFMLGMRENIPEFWNNFPFQTPAHWVTSLLVGSWWGRCGSDWWEPCPPEEYAREVHGFSELGPVVSV